MKITDYKIIKRTHRIANAIGCSKNNWSEFNGYYLQLISDDGLIGLGEASPLLGHSKELLDDVKKCLTAFGTTSLPLKFESVEQIREISTQFFEGKNCPSAQFSIETALLDLLATRKQISISELLFKTTHVSKNDEFNLKLNGLVGREWHCEQLLNLYNTGITCFKVKVGFKDETLSDEIERLTLLKSKLPKGCTFRLDANGSFSLDAFKQRIPEYKKINIEFIEEPVAFDDHSQLPADIDWAIDESIESYLKNETLASSTATHVVIKPSLVGGIFKTIDIVNLALKSKKQIVITHMFEGPVAFAANVHLALALHIKDTCGLYPYEAMENRDAIFKLFNFEAGAFGSPNCEGLGFVLEKVLRNK